MTYPIRKPQLHKLPKNFNRKDLSDYAEGMSLSRLISDSLLKQKEVAELFKLSPKQVNRLLSFSHVPQEIWDAVGDMSKVSARTASEIRAILNKNPEYKTIFIELAPKIKNGILGANSLLREVEKKQHLCFTKKNNHIAKTLMMKKGSTYSHGKKNSKGKMSILFFRHNRKNN